MKHSLIIKTIKAHKSFLITTHINPDADAIASALSVALVLKSLGKIVTVVNQDAVPSWLEFLPSTKLFKKAADLKNFDYDVSIILDCGDLARIGTVSQLLNNKKPMINIDHHKTNLGFGSINLVLPKSSSTAEVLFGIFEQMKVKFNKDLATLVYTGIMTDTGSFKYECTSSVTHRIVAYLMSYGVSSSDVYDRIYDSIPIKDFKLFLEAINCVELIKGVAVACLELRKDIMKKFSDGFDVRDKIFALLRSTKGVEVVVIFNEVAPSRTRVNLRSKHTFDVALLASAFGGGGHVRASGCTLDVGISEARKKVLRMITKGL